MEETKKKISTIFILSFFLLSSIICFGCSKDNTITFFFNEITYNSYHNLTETYLKITNNSNENITIYSQDFSIKTSSGQKTSYGFRGGNMIENKLTFHAGETGYVYLTFKTKLSNLENKETIFYLDNELKLLRNNKVEI